MIVIEAPNDAISYTRPSLFLGGGISGCKNWQYLMLQYLEYTDLLVYNPRRENFDTVDVSVSVQQIEWEHKYLEAAWAILFWFPAETLCPITLYELGAWSMTAKRLFVGCHPDYKRKLDVEIQTRLVRPDIEIVYSLEDLATQVKERM